MMALFFLLLVSSSYVAKGFSLSQQPTRDIDSLETWSRKQGIHSADGVELISNEHSDSDDRLLCVSSNQTKQLKKGEPMLIIPQPIILSSSRVEKELEPINTSNLEAALLHLKKHNVDMLTPQFFLWIKVLQEHNKGTKSVWFHWLQSLPPTFDTALSMDDIELECLPPYAWSLANVFRIHYNVFSQALDILLSCDDDDCDFLGLSNIQSNENLQKWAFNVVHSRCWPSDEDDDGYDLVPMGDMLNHAEQENARVIYDENGNCQIILVGDLILQEVNEEDGAKAETSTTRIPLTLDYGKSTTPAKFLTVFGFVDETTPKLFCQILSSHPTQRHVDMGYDSDKMVFSRRDDEEDDTPIIAQEVYDVVLYNLLEQVPSEQEAFYQAHTTGDNKRRDMYRTKYALETSILLKKHVDSTLRELEPLFHKMSTLDASQHPRLPTIYKHNALVYTTFQTVQQYLNHDIPNLLKKRKEEETNHNANS